MPELVKLNTLHCILLPLALSTLHCTLYPSKAPKPYPISSHLQAINNYVSFMLAHELPSSPGSHFAIVDSGTPVHIVFDHLFVVNPREDHTAVSGFSGTSSRATHRGDLSFRAFSLNHETNRHQYINMIQPNSTLVVPDCVRRLYSVRQATHAGYRVHLETRKPGLIVCLNYIPFVTDPETNLWLLPLFPPSTSDNGLYPLPSSTDAYPVVPTDAQNASTDLSTRRNQWLMEHHRLGHPSQKRQAAIEIEGATKPKVPKLTCPTCIASKARKANRPPPSDTEHRSTIPWEDVHSDLSGKISTKSARGYSYFVVFVCTATGAKACDFLTHKNHFIHAYKRLVTLLGGHPRTLRTDKGTEYINKDMNELLETNYVRHVVAAVNEHYSNGVAEHAVHTIRMTAKAMLLHANIPKKYWCYAISHATYLNNMTATSRADRTKTIYEVLFNSKPDVTRVPPYGAFTCIYKERRDLKDQSFDLTSIQGAFIGIAVHKKTLGYCISDGTRVHVTRHHIAFDPYLYPFKLNTTAPPAWQTFKQLTHANSDTPIATFGPPQTAPDLPHDDVQADNSEESDFDPDEQSPPLDPTSNVDPQEEDAHDTESDSDEEQVIPAPAEPALPTRSSRRVQTAPVKYRPPSRQTKLDRFNNDDTFRKQRTALLQTKVRKLFPGHGTFNGTITAYYPKSDTYHILFEDEDEEVDSYDKIQKYIPGTPEYAAEHGNALALTVALEAAVTQATSLEPQDLKEPNHYQDAMRASDASDWRKACDLEMQKLRDLNCWTVVKRTTLPKGTKVMGSRWTFRYKRDETGALRVVSHRSRFVAKGFTQIKNVHYFESYAPVASFVTLRLVFSLTALPHFTVNHYDVSVAFIESHRDDTTPPVYCECAEGYEDRKEYVYLLHRCLYGMVDSPRAWYQLWCTMCHGYGLTRLVSDGCVHVKYVNNSKTRKHTTNINLNNLAQHLEPLPVDDRVYADCPHNTAILIVVTYVDDNLVFTNSDTLRKAFAAHCNKRVRFNDEGPVRWYLGTQYTRDPDTGAVSASQELYINKLLARWHMTDCNPTKTPCSGKLDEVLIPLQNVPATPDPALLRDYKELIGSLLFLQTGTVPEISWIVSVLARYMTTAGEPHMAAGKKILRYLKSRKTVPIQWCALTSSQPGTVIGYADASFADIPATRLSTIGYVFLVNGGAVSWRSTKSPLQVLNAAEAEIVSLSAAAQECVFLRKLCIELGFHQHSPTIIYEDCEAAVALSKETRFRKRSKHIALRWYYIAERQSPQVGDLKVVHRRRTKMLADILASPRAAPVFIAFRDHILGVRSAFVADETE